MFVGNTIRGALGRSLYVSHHEAYKALRVDEAESAPNPYAISAPYPSRGEYRAGETLVFYVTIFGTACGLEQYVIDAAQDMCEGKLESCRLANVEQMYSREWSDAGAQTIPHCDTLTVDFLTPAEIFVQKKLATQIDFALLVDRLFGRIGSIIDLYGESEFVVPYRLVAQKPFVQAEYDLRTVAFKTNEQPVSGVLGRVRYSGNVTRYLPYIDLGSQIHIGRKTTRGCGEYSFEI